LLVYSFGLNDSEFVVAYETDDLMKFEELVEELRTSKARIYTKRDTPIITGIYMKKEDILNVI
jgi:chlorite dismutase